MGRAHPFHLLVKAAGTNLANALAGNLTGFSSIQLSGQPGADDPTIFVRGIGSLDVERATPLMMVDGVERSFNRLDPNEVESITVLKDASATAVFGVRGANGVILVTTKRGSAGKMSVSVSSEAGFQRPIRLYKYCNSYEYGMVYNESRLNDDPTLTPDELPFKQDVLQAFQDHSQPLIYPDTDWQKYLLKDAAFQTKHNVSVSGGTKNVRFFTSIGYISQDGLYKSFDTDYDSNIRYNRYNWRANLDIDITRTTTISVNMGGAYPCGIELISHCFGMFHGGTVAYSLFTACERSVVSYGVTEYCTLEHNLFKVLSVVFTVYGFDACKVNH